MANVITVTALNKYVRSLLESDPVLTDIAIKGEISNFNQHYKTKHCYFSLKDGASSVSAVMFRSDAQRVPFTPENGMSVVTRCRISLYERDGRFQVYVQDMFPDGAGAMQMAFEQLKARLAAEGLFAPEAKKPIPVFPKKVGLITSKTGAALQDILKVAAHRQPDAHFVLHPVTVQGEAAAGEIAGAIRRMDEKGGCDVIILARGGGSAEDLWVFNNEKIARAIYACETPVVTGIGHEIDLTIADLVADLRAPTPSAAAEQALPDMGHYTRHMRESFIKIQKLTHQKLISCYNSVSYMREHPALAAVVALPESHHRELERRQRELCSLIGREQAARLGRIQAAAGLAHSLSPLAVLGRGYSVALKDGKALRSVVAVAEGDDVTVQLADGTLGCRVQGIVPDKEQTRSGE